MTLRSRRKRQTTARTSIRAIRLSVAFLAATASLETSGQQPFSFPAPSQGSRSLPAPQQRALQQSADRHDSVQLDSHELGSQQWGSQVQPLAGSGHAASAQQPRDFRPVPREGFHRTSRPSPELQQTGWDLKWRRSSRVQPQTVGAAAPDAPRVVSPAAKSRQSPPQSGPRTEFATTHPPRGSQPRQSSQPTPVQAANPLRQVGHTRTVPRDTESARRHSRLQTATQPPQLSAVTPATYNELRSDGQPVLNAPRVAQRPVQRAGAPSRANFFADPFGDDPKGPQTERQQQSNPAGNLSQSSRSGGAEMLLPPPGERLVPDLEPTTMQNRTQSVPADNGLALPQKEAPTFPLPSPVESQSASESQSAPESRAAPEVFKPAAPATPPQQATPASPRNEESMRDMLRNNRPTIPQGSGTPPQSDRQQRSAPEQFKPQPFEPPAIEEIGREQPFRDRDTSPDSASDRKGGFQGIQNTTKGIADYSCEEFRERIAAQTIDLVSLDISPPFRPDEFNEDRFERLKAEFQERQPIRPWRNLSGEVVARGRLQDLAYEKAVIETEQGETARLPVEQLSEGDIAYITESWGLPKECLIEQVAYTPRKWKNMAMTWKASNICHTPLYFQDVNLERYGHTHGPLAEPLVQTAHFFGNIIILPYKMGVHSPHECIYPLGYYRPGNCAPWITPAIPISAKGAINQAATMTGMFWLIP